MADAWDPFADPADAPKEPEPPRRPTVEPKEEIEGEPEELGPGIAIPSLTQLEEVLQAAKLKPCPELVQKSFEGDGAAVAKLLEEGDPNSIWLREERLKGSDGCCQCAISWEEYTPLIAACMEKHDDICELLLRHAATQLSRTAAFSSVFRPFAPDQTPGPAPTQQ